MAEGYRQTDTLTADLTKDLIPQVQAGNASVTQALTQALSSISPEMGADIVEGLKSVNTVPLAMRTLQGILTEQNASQALYQLAPLTNSLDYFAFRSPQVEYDTNLANTEAIRNLANVSANSQALAQNLMAQGETASAAMVEGLRARGVESAKDASAGIEAFRKVLNTIDEAQVRTKGRDNLVALRLVHPALGEQDFLSGVGPVDEAGVWHPQIKSMGVGTPVEGELVKLLERPQIRKQLDQYGVRSIAPDVVPVPSTIRPQKAEPSLERLEANPRYQAMSTADQEGVRAQFFEKHVAIKPEFRNLFTEDPAAFERAKQKFIQRTNYPGTLVQPALAISQQPVQPAVGPPAPQDPYADIARAETLGGATATAQLGAGALGTVQGIVPSRLLEPAREVVGNRPGAELAGRAVADTALGFGPGIAMEGMRGIGTGLDAGKPVLPGSVVGLVRETVPEIPYLTKGFAKEPTSALTQGMHDALRAALITKAVQALPITAKAGVAAAGVTYYGGKALAGKVAEKAIGKGGKEAIGNVIRNIFKRGYMIEDEKTVATAVAAASPSTFSAAMGVRILDEAPEVTILGKGSTKITMKDGTELDPTAYFKERARLEAARANDPNYTPGWISVGGLTDVAKVEGTQTAVNKFFENAGAALQIEGAAAVKGMKLQQVKGMWTVFEENGAKKTEFPTKGEATQYINEAKVPPTEVAEGMFKQQASAGENGYYAILNQGRMKELGEKFTGNAPQIPEYGEAASNVTRIFKPPTEMAKMYEGRYNIPIFSRGIEKMEAALKRQRDFMNPYVERANQLLKDMKLGKEKFGQPSTRSEGYTKILETTPGSPEWNKILTEYKLDDQIAQRTKQYFRDLFNDLGLDGDLFMELVIPKVKQHGSMRGAFPSSELPRTVRHVYDDIEEGMIQAGKPELDIRTHLFSVTNQVTFKHFAKQAWQDVVDLTQMLSKWPDAKIVLEEYARAVRGWDTRMEQAWEHNMGAFVVRTLHGNDVALGDVKAAYKEITANWRADMSSAYFGFRIKSMLNQLTTIVQQVHPTLGSRYTTKGILTRNDPTIRQAIKESGAADDIIYFNTEGRKQAIGVSGVQKMDTFVRESTAAGTWHAVTENLPAYTAAKQGYTPPPVVAPELTVPGVKMQAAKPGTVQADWPVDDLVRYTTINKAEEMGTIVGHTKAGAVKILTPRKTTLTITPGQRGLTRMGPGQVGPPAPPPLVGPVQTPVTGSGANVQIPGGPTALTPTVTGAAPGGMNPLLKARYDFLRKSRLGYLDPVEQNVVMDLIDQGKEYEAKLTAMRYMTKEVNFDYAPHMRPPVLNTIPGQLFGNFGVFPLNYPNYLKHMATRGVTAWDRNRRVGLWALNNMGLKLTLGGLFGIDMANYLWLEPAYFTGGPNVQTVGNVAKGVLTADPNALVRAGTQILATKMPGSGQLMDLKAAIEEEDALRALGFKQQKGK